MRLLTDSNLARARYAEILEHFAEGSVYHTPAWLRVWEDLGAELAFVEVDAETMVPFVCKGAGALRRAYSLPFDTYGGPVTARSNGPVSFEGIIERLDSPSVRVADFGAVVASRNGALRPVATHIVDLGGGYDAAARNYTDANRRNIRQAVDHGVRVAAVSQHAVTRDFYRLHLQTVKRHGARPLPMAFFESVYARLVSAGAATFYLAFHQDRVVAGNLVLRHRDRSYDWMWVYDDRMAPLRATNLMLDHAIRDEAGRGSRELNLGASPNDRLGSVRFKQSFGARPFTYAVYTHTGPLVAAARRVWLGVGRIGARIRSASS
ncbi:MAG TPA: GNAT family N-acetyltransferase [Candidatus Krumholzibacteria bacterium]|nr:GNAT family N-acetyltransferase [Candidatus Krumholzibacteria bacterium]